MLGRVVCRQMPLVAKPHLKGDTQIFKEGFYSGIVGLDAFLGISPLPHLSQELLSGIGRNGAVLEPGVESSKPLLTCREVKGGDILPELQLRNITAKSCC